ncbi:uncharacterized protein DDB_G0284459-like [Perca flavescens]|uniref:uncharacterized protein DDB_G0284459-like n=1 Tax=Perca flavescens TaxID=8167 RepID=UPI00106E2DEB|nr:uncharacterized protein DDB_G0284459-like [Perca flavescens]
MRTKSKRLAKRLRRSQALTSFRTGDASSSSSSTSSSDDEGDAEIEVEIGEDPPQLTPEQLGPQPPQLPPLTLCEQ